MKLLTYRRWHLGMIHQLSRYELILNFGISEVGYTNEDLIYMYKGILMYINECMKGKRKASRNYLINLKTNFD